MSEFKEGAVYVAEYQMTYLNKFSRFVEEVPCGTGTVPVKCIHVTGCFATFEYDNEGLGIHLRKKGRKCLGDGFEFVYLKNNGALKDLYISSLNIRRGDE